MSDTPKAVREYLSKIGAKGGAAGKGDPKRRELNRKAVRARWAKRKKGEALPSEKRRKKQS